MTVTPTPLRPQPTTRPEVDMEAYRQLLADYATIKEQKKQIEALEKQLAEQLKQAIGFGNVGVLDGLPAYQYVPGGKVASTQLKKDHPEFWDFCAEKVVEWKLNTDKLQEHFPELYREYVEKKLVPVGSRTVFITEAQQ